MTNESKIYKKLDSENAKLRDELESFMDDWDMEDSRPDLWGIVNKLIQNEIKLQKLEMQETKWD